MFLPPYDCVLCTQGVEEDLFHLLIGCPFAQLCWINIGLFANLDHEPYVVLESFKAELQVPFFMEIIIIMSWCIWMVRNDHIFKGIAPSLSACLQHFKFIFAKVML
uniref:Reverse transcriptase zinc-binding domain-containing protein n=1 Tax=Setaria viridis TaxID=4556 RepID=A0A4V6D8C8_SETVI|nr:hypothetical protein SEVIR_4G130700v2 [Setaria viridis]